MNDTTERNSPIEMTLIVSNGEIVGIAGEPPNDLPDLWTRLNVTVVDYSKHIPDGPLVAVLGNQLVSMLTTPAQVRVLQDGNLSLDDALTLLGLARLRRINGRGRDHG